MLVHKEVFKFPMIDEMKQGMFFIDFVGGETNASAKITKGNLTIINDDITGRNLVIIDEKNEICKSEKTGIHLHNKFFKACPKTGVIKLPESL